MRSLFKIGLTIFVLATVAGCSETRFLEEGHSPQSQKYVSVEKFAGDMKGEDVEIKFMDQRESEGRLLSLTKDSLRMEMSDSSPVVSTFAMRDIEYVQYRLKWFGGIQGFFIGTAGGAAAFGGFAASMTPVGASQEMKIGTLFWTLTGGFLGAIAGTIIGANVGGIQRVQVIHPVFDTAAVSTRLPDEDAFGSAIPPSTNRGK